MATPGWIARLALRWKLENTTQVIIILVVFACTGITVMLIKPPIMYLVAGEEGNTKLASVLYYVFIFPIYNVVLLIYGFVFGQFRFFWEFEKKTARNIGMQIHRLGRYLKRKLS